jgi:hypothetical protein
MQKLILNIGLNVDGLPAFTPAFALKALGRFFTVEAHEVITSATEQTVVARVIPDCPTPECDEGRVFVMATELHQQAIAWAYESNVAATGTLTGPEAHLWDGGRFNREFFVTLDEAATRNAKTEAL